MVVPTAMLHNTDARRIYADGRLFLCFRSNITHQKQRACRGGVMMARGGQIRPLTCVRRHQTARGPTWATCNPNYSLPSDITLHWQHWSTPEYVKLIIQPCCSQWKQPVTPIATSCCLMHLDIGICNRSQHRDKDSQKMLPLCCCTRWT